jgi:hypothetical protein
MAIGHQYSVVLILGFLLSICWCVSFPESDEGEAVGDRCTADGQDGICVVTSNCSKVVKRVEHICSYVGMEPVICCVFETKAESG